MDKLDALKRDIEALSPARQLFLAAALLEQGQPHIAIQIAENVVSTWKVGQLLRASTS